MFSNFSIKTIDTGMHLGCGSETAMANSEYGSNLSISLVGCNMVALHKPHQSPKITKNYNFFIMLGWPSIL